MCCTNGTGTPYWWWNIIPITRIEAALLERSLKDRIGKEEIRGRTKVNWYSSPGKQTELEMGRPYQPTNLYTRDLHACKVTKWSV